MTLKELCDNIHISSRLKIIEAKTNAVLADPYNIYEHTNLGNRTVYGIWASTETYDGINGIPFNCYYPVIYCYVLESNEGNA